MKFTTRKVEPQRENNASEGTSQLQKWKPQMMTVFVHFPVLDNIGHRFLQLASSYRANFVFTAIDNNGRGQEGDSVCKSTEQVVCKKKLDVRLRVQD